MSTKALRSACAVERRSRLPCEHKHDPAYTCRLCGMCCPCKHQYRQVNGKWEVKCKNGMWRPVEGPMKKSEGF